MPIIHQEKDFDFIINTEDENPPRVHVIHAKKMIVVKIGVPGSILPNIDKYENVDQDELDWVWKTIADYQENYMIAWRRIHGKQN